MTRSIIYDCVTGQQTETVGYPSACRDCALGGAILRLYEEDDKYEEA